MNDTGSLQLCVGFQRKYLPVALTLGQHEAGDPLTLGHLCTELERQTDIPSRCMSFVVNGNNTINNSMVRKNLDKPLFLVGIRHNTKLHMYADTVTPYWDDDQMKLLTQLETRYDKVKEKMNAIMHKLNLVRSDGRLQSAQRTVAFDKHVSSLEAIEDEIRTLQNKVMGIEVMPVNHRQAKQIKQKMFANMEGRLSDVSSILSVIKQKRITSAKHCFLMSHV